MCRRRVGAGICIACRKKILRPDTGSSRLPGRAHAAFAVSPAHGRTRHPPRGPVGHERRRQPAAPEADGRSYIVRSRGQWSSRRTVAGGVQPIDDADRELDVTRTALLTTRSERQVAGLSPAGLSVLVGASALRIVSTTSISPM